MRSALLSFVRLVVALVAVFVSHDRLTLSAQGSTARRAPAQNTSPAARPAQPLKPGGDAINVQLIRQALDPQRITIDRESVRANPDSLVVLIGENHASVEAQINLAELLSQLVKKQLIDAVLVEGTNGPIIANANEMAPTNNLAEAFWRGKLEWGQLAGFEYVALNHPRLTVHGVEDMAAKSRYEVTEVRGLSKTRLDDILAIPRRGSTHLQSAAAAILAATGSEDNGLRDINALLDAAIKDASGKALTLTRAEQPATELELEILKLATDSEAALRSILPALEAAEKDQAEHTRLVNEHNRDVEVLKKFSFGLDLPELKAKMTVRIARIEALKERLDVFERQYGGQLLSLTESRTAQDALASRLETARVKVRAPAKAFSDSYERAIDLYFCGANEVRRLVARQWGQAGEAPPEILSGLRQIDHLFETETERIKAASEKEAPLRLLERDKAMALNTASFLKPGKHRRVALIVGYAHLAGIAQQLSANKISYIGGGLQGNDSRAEWESVSWDQRRSPSTVLTTAKIKELSLLRNRVWRTEAKAAFELLRTLDERLTTGRRLPTLNGPVRLYEGLGTKADKTMIVSKYLAGPTASVSAHVLARGPLPSDPTQVFNIIDRTAATSEVRQSSDRSAEFLYLYRRVRTGKPEYRLITANGEVSPANYRSATTPPSVRFRVVEIEPDYIEESGLAVSPSARAIGAVSGLRREGAAPPPADAEAGGEGGGGKPPVSPDPPPMLSGEGGAGRPLLPLFVAGTGPEQRRVSVFLTTNLQRARRNKEKLLKQGTLSGSDVILREEAQSLTDLPFATSSGEHAGLVVLLAQNTKEFRAAVEEAGRLRKFDNRQVALITCGDAFRAAAELRESVLQAGAILVWSPQRQLTPEAGRLLRDEVVTQLQGNSFSDVDHLMRKSLESLQRSRPGDSALVPLQDAVTHMDFD